MEKRNGDRQTDREREREKGSKEYMQYDLS